MSIQSKNISRRGFLGASAAVAASAALLSATGCSAEASLDAADKHEQPVDPAEGGEWWRPHAGTTAADAA